MKEKALEISLDKLEDIEVVLKLCHVGTFQGKNSGPWKYYKPRLERDIKTLEFMKNHI